MGLDSLLMGPFIAEPIWIMSEAQNDQNLFNPFSESVIMINRVFHRTSRYYDVNEKKKAFLGEKIWERGQFSIPKISWKYIFLEGPFNLIIP